MELKRYIRVKFSQLLYTLVVDNKPDPDPSFHTYGHQIDDIVHNMLMPLTADAIGYKIEDNGVLVGLYVVDFDNAKNPFVAIKVIRKVYTDADNLIINNQIDQWLQKEYPLV